MAPRKREFTVLKVILSIIILVLIAGSAYLVKQCLDLVSSPAEPIGSVLENAPEKDPEEGQEDEDEEGGGWLEEKPEHLTHLNSQFLVPKRHPRILFRGKLDTLEAELLLCQQAAESLISPVGEILALARQLIRCDVLEEPVPEKTLCNLTEAEIRKRSHFPQDYYGQPHFMPALEDGVVMARLNRARCAAREAELAAAEVFSDREGNPTRVDILRALNRMSSMLYILMIQEKKKK